MAAVATEDLRRHRSEEIRLSEIRFECMIRRGAMAWKEAGTARKSSALMHLDHQNEMDLSDAGESGARQWREGWSGRE